MPQKVKYLEKRQLKWRCWELNPGPILLEYSALLHDLLKNRHTTRPHPQMINVIINLKF